MTRGCVDAKTFTFIMSLKERPAQFANSDQSSQYHGELSKIGHHKQTDPNRRRHQGCHEHHKNWFRQHNAPHIYRARTHHQFNEITTTLSHPPSTNKTYTAERPGKRAARKSNQ